MLGDQPSLGEAVDASSSSDIDVTVFGDFISEFVVLDEVVG